MVRKRFPATSQDRMNSISRYVCDQQLHLVMEFSSRLNDKLMERAVRQLLEEEPILACRWMEGPRPYWKRREKLESLPLFMMVTCTSPYGELDVFLTSPSDPGADPLLQVRLFRGDVDLLCLKLNHVVCDGMGAKGLAYALASIYSKMVREDIFEDGLTHRIDRSMNPIWNGLPRSDRWTYRKMAWKSMRRTEPGGPEWSFPFTSRESLGRRVLVKRFDAELSDQINSFCQRRGVSVNDLFLATFVRSLFEMRRPQEGTPVPFQVVFDLRQLVPGKGGNIANLEGVLFPRFSRDGKKSSDDVLDEVHRTMSALKDGKTGAVSIPFIGMTYGIVPYGRMRRGFERSFDISVKRRSLAPVFSNVGALDDAKLDFGGVRPQQAFLTTPIAFPPLLLVGLSSYLGNLSLSIGYCSYGVDVKDVERLLDLFAEGLADHFRP